ncbi:hypothetical protein ZIOFF_011665 [Zingiber officinale]|uniref:Beta-fructofuranosidase N-terminal domain-containing protein n=1 Tax=Zingiber officinale TaxID=94328 RepID=A0A8J5HYL0_ZINOF|nr:hypothetical protein ZIOFF_011665 [Zingiber officinale]
MDASSSYPPLLHPNPTAPPSPTNKTQFRRLSVEAAAVLILCLLALAYDGAGRPARSSAPAAIHGARRPEQARSLPLSRGPARGVSEKSTASRLFSSHSFRWSDSMLRWQRTAFHFQPEKNWMNG